MIVSKKFSFDAAHYLPNYEGKCRNLHGHHWVVEVGIEGLLNPTTGMVLDFADLNLFLLPLKDILDHKSLNEIYFENPTAENIADFIWLWIKEHWSNFPNLRKMPDDFTDCLKLKFVRVWETENSMVEHSEEVKVGGI